ncbi:U3 small nucleolar RNA-associated protein 7 [Nematocida displodere]|uniref:U3 small nucleolar RNA-associated protein 7 n=1 Tax=Nematocida displodere TaxID=1805483 RepID=A0A177EE14_9MICR|nr:U3 small nucleolar RNA-associated protein 7 [Nematocida displodere]
MTLRQQQEHIARRKEHKKEYESTLHRFDILNTATKGEIHTDGTKPITTDEMYKHIDMGTKSKAYKLALENGPYSARYTLTGNNVLYFGQNDASVVDAIKLTPRCERNLNDQIHDGTFLHRESFFALAQSQCVYIYDNNGVEVHALRDHAKARKLQFLQDHFLLATLTDGGFLKYHDTTMGKLVSDIKTRERSAAMTHDRSTGVVYLSGPSGHVSLWSPRSTDYLAKILCHRSKVRNIRVSDSGSHLFTSAGNELAVWDVRNTFSPIDRFTFPQNIFAMDVSQQNKIAVSQRASVTICSQNGQTLLTHHLGRDTPHSLTFMPYEDILAVGTSAGVENIVVPGAGLEIYRRNENPRASAQERANTEVRRILEKIPGDMIALENEIGTEIKETFREEIAPMKLETPAGKVRRLMRMNYG